MVKKTSPPSPSKSAKPVVAAPPPYVPKTPVTKTELKKLYREVEDYWIDQADYYGYGNGDLADRPDNVVTRMQAILGAVDKETAKAAVKRAKDCIQTMILGAWARGKIDGPLTERSLEKRIKRAESLVQMLKDKGQHEAAQRQSERVADLKNQLSDLTKE
jgi:hypothetical protein